MKSLKKPITIALIFSILTCAPSLTGCFWKHFEPTPYEKGEKLYENSLKFVEENRTFSENLIEISYNIEGKEYSNAVEYDYGEDCSDPDNPKAYFVETRNSLRGYTEEYIYTDGIMYASSEGSSSTAVPLNSIDLFYSFLPYYDYYREESWVTTVISENDDGSTTATYHLTEQSERNAIYSYLYWIADDLPLDKMMLSAFREEYIYSKSGRLECINAYFTVKAKNTASEDVIRGSIKTKPLYEYPEITAPEGFENYNVISDHNDIIKIREAVTKLQSSSRGSFSADYTYEITYGEGLYQSVISHVESEYMTSPAGLFTMISTNAIELYYLINGETSSSEDTFISVYDGEKLTESQEGSSHTIPCAPIDAKLYALASQLDLFFDPLFVKDITKSETDGVTKYSIRLTDQKLSDHLIGIFNWLNLDHDTHSIEIIDEIYDLYIDSKGNIVGASHEVRATFTLHDGQKATFVQSHNMQVENN